MSYIEVSTFDLYNKCDIKTSVIPDVCLVEVGDTIRVGCYGYWSAGTPMNNVWILLRFQDYWGNTYHDIWLGQTDSAGWLAKNHTVTEADIADLGENGYVKLFTWTEPKGWSPSYGVRYAPPPPPPVCSDHLWQDVCEAFGCYWWAGACHSEPEPPPETCSQVFYIKDKDTNENLVVDTVSVDSKTVTRVVSTYYVTLTKGETYIVKATKSGYGDLSESFVPNCPSSLTFYMTKKEEKIYPLLMSCLATYTAGTVHFYAELEEWVGTPIPNKPIKFYINGSYATTENTNTDGNVSKDYARELSPGTYDIKTEFIGDANYHPSICTSTLIVEVVPTKASWKSVSEPYWTEGNLRVRIDYEAQGLVAGVRYLPRITNVSKPPSCSYSQPYLTPSNPSGYVEILPDQLEAFDSFPNGCGMVWDIILKDKDANVICDTVRKTIPTKPTLKKATDLLCYDATCESGESVTIKASLAEKEDPFDSIGGKAITFTIEKGDSAASIDATTDESTGLAQIVFPGMFTGELGDYAITAGFIGDAVYAASSCSAVLTVTEVVKKDTVICDFDILDAAGNKVTDLVVGAKYKVRAWLCVKDVLGIGGCKFAALGCASGDEVSGGELTFVKADDTPIDSLKTGKTDVNGWGGVYWTPKDTDVGTFSVKLKFTGISGYNACESGTETITVTKPAYTINVTVKDENGSPIEGVYVDIDKWDYLARTEKRCTDVAVYVGECKEEEWQGDGYNVVTNSEGKVSIGLPEERAIPAEPEPLVSWIIRVGKLGYLNPTTQHEEWGDDQTVKEEYTEPFEFNLEFALTKITEEDKFIITTEGTKEGDSVLVYEPLPLTKCFIRKPLGYAAKKILLAPNLTVQFDKSDGLVEGKEYAITTSIPIVSVDFATGPSWCGVFTGIKTITIGRYGAAGIVCGWIGIDAGSDECRRFWVEFADPVYVANIVTGVLKGKDIYGAPYEPGLIEFAFLPLILVPWVPASKGKNIFKKAIGSILRKTKEGKSGAIKVKAFVEANSKLIDEAIAGDSAIKDWTKTNRADDLLHEAGDLTGDAADAKILEAKILLQEAVDAAEVTAELKSLKRGYFKQWMDNSKTAYDEAVKKGDVTLSFDDYLKKSGIWDSMVDVINKHTREAFKTGDWATIRKIWDDIATENIVFLDKNLKGLEKEFVSMHNLRRFTKKTYINQLSDAPPFKKTDKILNRFDEDVDFIVRHIGEDAGERGRYVHAIGQFSDAEVDDMVREIRAVSDSRPTDYVHMLGNDCADNIEALRSLNKAKKEGGAFDGLRKIGDDIKDGKTTEGKKAGREIVGEGADIPPSAKDKAVMEGMDANSKDPHYIPFFKWLDESVIKETGVPWAKLTLGQKVNAYLRITVKLSRHCFMLFIVEEAHQLFTFSLFVAGEELKGWWLKTPAEKEAARAFYQKTIDKARAAWLPGVLIDLPFMAICPIMAPAYIMVELGAKHYIDTCQERLDLLSKDIYPYGVEAGVAGFCRIPVRCSVQGSRVICSNAMIISWTCGHTRREIEDVVVKEEPYECVITAYADGYIEASKKITINPYDVGRTLNEVYLELTPESNVVDETGENPFPPVVPPTADDFDNNPSSAGGTVPNEDFFGIKAYGDIYCESLPEMAARIWIRGGKWADWHDTGQVTNWTVTTIEVGDYYVKFVKTGYKECLANDGRPIKVLTKQIAHAACEMKEIKPIVGFDWSPPSPVVNEVVTFDATDSKAGTGATITSYTWYCDDVKFGTNSVTATKTFSEGSYRIKLKVTNSYGYSEEIVKVLTVKPPVCPSSTASFIHSPTNPKVGEEVTFTSNSTTTGATLVSWVWDFNDGTTGTGEQVKHTFTAKKIYNVKLTVKNDCCTNSVGKDSTTRSVIVEVATGFAHCYCTCSASAYPSYCDPEQRPTKILTKKEGEATWKEQGSTKVSGYTNVTLETGKYLIKYSLLGVMESASEEITITEAEFVEYRGDIQTNTSVLPASQPAKVVAIIDGDSIRTDVTDLLPAPMGKDYQEIRVVGYDAYGSGTTFGGYAKHKLESLIPVGTIITLKVDPHLALGYYNRTLGGVFHQGTDIAIEMLKSCLVLINKQSYLNPFEGWIDPEEYLRLWKDPNGTNCILKKDAFGEPYVHIPRDSIDTITRTFKIENGWKALYFKVDYYDKANKKLNIEDIDLGQIEGNTISNAISYYADTYLIKLFACVDVTITKPKWVEVDAKIVTLETKSVTLQCEHATKIYVDGELVQGGLGRLAKTLRELRT